MKTYRDLVLVVNTTASQTTTLFTQFNSDTGSNYNYVNMRGTGSATASGAASNEADSGLGQVSTSLNSIVFSIMDYSATDKHKTYLSRADSPAHMTQATAGRWASTSAITSVKIYFTGGLTFPSGSTFSLYGIES